MFLSIYSRMKYHAFFSCYQREIAIRITILYRLIEIIFVKRDDRTTCISYGILSKFSGQPEALKFSGAQGVICKNALCWIK